MDIMNNIIFSISIYCDYLVTLIKEELNEDESCSIT